MRQHYPVHPLKVNQRPFNGFKDQHVDRHTNRTSPFGLYITFYTQNTYRGQLKESEHITYNELHITVLGMCL